MEKHIEVIMDKCTGCKLCELACSAAKTGKYTPHDSRIRVVLVDIPEIPVPILLDNCDYCLGEPQCVPVCLPKALVWKEMEAKPHRPKVSEAKAIAREWLAAVNG